MPVLVYSVPEFAQLHGGRESMRKLDSRTWGFADGASIVLDQHGYEQPVDPPTDRKELLLARRRFHSLYVFAGEQDFQSLASSIRGNGFTKFSDATARRYSATAGMDDAEALVVLANIKGIVSVERAAIAKIDLELSRLPEEIEKRQAKDRRAEFERRMEIEEGQRYTKIRAAVDAICLDNPNPELENEDGNLGN